MLMHSPLRHSNLSGPSQETPGEKKESVRDEREQAMPQEKHQNYICKNDVEKYINFVQEDGFEYKPRQE